MIPQLDSLNSCFSEVTGRGCSFEACFPRKDLDTAGPWCAPGQTCRGQGAAENFAGEVLPHVKTAPRLTKALLEAYNRIGKLTAPLTSPVETPAVSEQLCKPAVLLQVEATEARATSAMQPYADHFAPSQQQQPMQQQRVTEGDNSDTASETGSSSTPPPRKGRRGTVINRGTSRKAAARSAQPPPTPVPRLTQVDFPWTRMTASRLVQSWLALEGPEQYHDEAFFPLRKAARFGMAGSPATSVLLTCPELCADMASDSRAELAADVAPQPVICPQLLPPVDCAADLALMSAQPAELDASKAGSLPSVVPEWRVQVWPVPPNCNRVSTLP
ncbi:hypothetical protein COCOBI_10-5240 [Coccomyxa sp. Obi]|nr:hypothetical protein COCOBI_10-5240 [Coccomyxa sp. Obi]